MQPVMLYFACSAGNGVCLEDEPPAAATQTDPTALPGLTFDADAQCQAQMGPDAFFCTGFIDVSYLTLINSYACLNTYVCS